MIRKILSVIAGYAVFVTASLVLFKVSGQNPHAAAATSFMIFTMICGSAFSIAAGFVAQFIASATDLKVNYVLALILAGFAAFSFFRSEGNHWTQLLAIFIFAPLSILGGLIYNKRQ